MLSRIRQIAVSVADLEASKHFYGEKLGLKKVFEFPNLAFYDMAGIWLMLSGATAQEPARPGSVLYFEVTDIQKAYDELRERGVAFITEPHMIADMGSYELWLSDFRDPDGTVLAIRAEVPK